MSKEAPAVIQPWVYEDMVTGHKLSIYVSPYYSTLRIDDRYYYFNREDGSFDGTGMDVRDKEDG